jgi:tripartite-type tricarboxylate transporter receptor subunit TctC
MRNGPGPAKCIALLLALLMLFACPCAILAADVYPSKIVRVIVPMPPGGGTDFVARVIINKLSERLGERVIPDNRSGAGSIIGTDMVAKASPDGYTLLFVAGSFTTQPALQKVPYDPVKSFVPVAMFGRMLGSLLVHPSVPANTVNELVALAKEKPGKLVFATSGMGSNAHFGAELFKKMAGIDFLIVHFRGGGGPARIDVLGGHSDAMFGTLEGLELVKAGKLKLLATCGLTRSRMLPNVPSMSESLPGYELSQTYQMLAPAGTPLPIIERLDKELKQIVNSDEITKQLATQGVEREYVGPTDARSIIEKEINKWARLAKETNIKAEP